MYMSRPRFEIYSASCSLLSKQKFTVRIDCMWFPKFSEKRSQSIYNSVTPLPPCMLVSITTPARSSGVLPQRSLHNLSALPLPELLTPLLIPKEYRPFRQPAAELKPLEPNIKIDRFPSPVLSLKLNHAGGGQ